MPIARSPSLAVTRPDANASPQFEGDPHCHPNLEPLTCAFRFGLNIVLRLGKSRPTLVRSSFEVDERAASAEYGADAAVVRYARGKIRIG